MNYKITITNPGNQSCNPLLSLAGREYATRDEACEAIYEAMYDVIDSEGGCEMVERKNLDDEIRCICGDLMMLSDERYGESVIYRDDDVPTNRSFWSDCGVTEAEIENPDDHVPVRPLSAEIIQNVVYDTDLLRFQESANWEDFNGLRDRLLIALRDDENYSETCHAYILREGHAREDGVTANIEEIA